MNNFTGRGQALGGASITGNPTYSTRNFAKPMPSMNAQSLVTYWHQSDLQLEVAIDLWLSKTLGNPHGATAQDIFTFFNNTYCDFRVRGFPLTFSSPSLSTRDLYTEPICEFFSTPNVPAYSEVLDRSFTMGFLGIQHRLGKYQGAPNNYAQEVLVKNGTGAFTVSSGVINPNCISQLQLAIDPDETVDPNTVKITSNVSDVYMEFSVYKDTKRIRILAMESEADELIFNVSPNRDWKIYQSYRQGDVETLVGQIDAGPGDIVIASYTADRKVVLSSITNDGLVTRPSRHEIRLLESARRMMYTD